MKDFRVTIKVRNANLLRAIEKEGYKPGPIFASKVGIGYATLIEYVNLTKSPCDKDGSLLPAAEKLALFLRRMPVDLWSEDQLTPLSKNKADIDMSFEDIGNFLESSVNVDPALMLERREEVEDLEKMLENLTEREKKVLEMRNGIDGEQMTLSEIGKKMGICKQIVRHIEAKAIRKIRGRLGFYKWSPQEQNRKDAKLRFFNLY